MDRSVAGAMRDLQRAVGLLDHHDVAIKHNAADVLGRLVGTHPDVVLPAVDALRELADQDEAAVRRVAIRALARLATCRPGAVAER